MIISREELFHLLGVGAGFTTGHSTTKISADGVRRATISWDEDEFRAELSDEIEGESGDTLMWLAGRHVGASGFDLEAHDWRPEASDPRDVVSVAAAFSSLTRGMIERI